MFPRLHVVESLVEERGIGRVLGLLAGSNEHPNLPALAASGNHLKLTMHDIAVPMEGMKVPGHDQVVQLIEFIKDWDQKSPMLSIAGQAFRAQPRRPILPNVF